MAGYGKLWSGITESSLWDGSKEARLLFVTLLAKADSSGFVEAAPSGLARLANLSRDEIAKALEELSSPDPESKSKVADGRRVAIVPRGVCVVNYEEYRKRRDDEDRREYMRDYMRDYRAKNTSPVNSCKPCKPGLAQAEAEAEAEAGAEAGKESKDSSPVGVAEAPPPPAKARAPRAVKAPPPAATLETILHGSKDEPSQRWLGFWALHGLFGQAKNRQPKTTAALYVEALARPGVTIESIHEHAAALVAQTSDPKYLPSLQKWIEEEAYLVPITNPGAKHVSKSSPQRAAVDAAFNPATALRGPGFAVSASDGPKDAIASLLG